MDDYVVCKDEDIRDGEMKELDLGDTGSKCLLVKEEGRISAFSNKCTHYGAPLVNGAFSDGRIRCPWHGACFSAKTGDIEDFPGLDSLHKYDVCVDKSGMVRVQAPKFGSTKRVRLSVKRDPSNSETIVIIGGGGSAAACAETLRTADAAFTGRIVVVSKETGLPYDRPKLSKAMASTAESIALRSKEFYDQWDIEFVLGKEVVSVDTDKKEIRTDDSELMKYDRLVLATGGSPRILEQIPGVSLPGVSVLRTPQDANGIAAQSEGKNVVIIGTSFIGMEVASSLVDNAASVTVVGNGAYPFLPLGQHVGLYLQKLHESKGVKFQLNASPVTFNGSNRLESVQLDNGSTLPADVCVLGVGVVPNTGFLKDSAVSMDQRGFVSVNEYMQTNVTDVLAVGDIAKFPLPTESEPVAIGHWQIAHAHGRTAGLTLAGRREPLKTVPFFWSVQYGKSLRYAGYAPQYDDVVVKEEEEGKFVVYYTKGEEVKAVATLMRDPVAAQFANRVRAGKSTKKEDVI